MKNRLDELELQLQSEQKENRSLKQNLTRAEQKIEAHTTEIECLKKVQRPEQSAISSDEEVIKIQAIHKAEQRAKEKEIETLRQELQEAKALMTETGLYMELATLKKELKSKDTMITTLNEQIEQLQRHIELQKS
ncbi:MAG: hypothetical protein ABS949_09035 [Solibacillus sp.]